MTGPRAEPPIPTLTTFRIRLPVWPAQSPHRTRSANEVIRSSTACTPGITSTPSTTILSSLGGAQCDVQDGTALRGVDLLATEHGVDPAAEAGLLGELYEEPDRLVGDEVLGVIEVDAGRLGREPLAAQGVVGKQVSQA